MAHRPIPVIMVSYLTKAGADITVRAMLAGAVDFVAKPGGPIMRDLAGLRDELIRKVRAAARSRPRIPRRRSPCPAAPPVAPRPVASTPAPSPPPRGAERFQRLVVIGSSTAGPRRCGSSWPISCQTHRRRTSWSSTCRPA